MRLVIMNGYAGSGKSTLSFRYAKEHGFALLEQDHFLFRMNPSSLKTRRPDEFNHEIALKNLLSSMENYMKSGKDILLEGALVSITKGDPMHLTAFINLAAKHNYKPIVITLVADEKTRKRRQKNRGNTLKLQTDKKLVDALNNLEVATEKFTLDTSRLTIKKSLEEIQKIIGK